MAFRENPWTVLVEEVVHTGRELLETAPLTDPQRQHVAWIIDYAADLERRRAYADAVARVGITPYTERLARELGLRKAS